jgi:hypothetical protein
MQALAKRPRFALGKKQSEDASPTFVPASDKAAGAHIPRVPAIRPRSF